MNTDSCDYPPRLAADVEITAQRDGERTVFKVVTSIKNYVGLLRRMQRLEEALALEGRIRDP